MALGGRSARADAGARPSLGRGPPGRREGLLPGLHGPRRHALRPMAVWAVPARDGGLGGRRTRGSSGGRPRAGARTRALHRRRPPVRVRPRSTDRFRAPPPVAAQPPAGGAARGGRRVRRIAAVPSGRVSRPAHLAAAQPHWSAASWPRRPRGAVGAVSPAGRPARPRTAPASARPPLKPPRSPRPSAARRPPRAPAPPPPATPRSAPPPTPRPARR